MFIQKIQLRIAACFCAQFGTVWNTSDKQFQEQIKKFKNSFELTDQAPTSVCVIENERKHPDANALDQTRNETQAHTHTHTHTNAQPHKILGAALLAITVMYKIIIKYHLK